MSNANGGYDSQSKLMDFEYVGGFEENNCGGMEGQ